MTDTDRTRLRLARRLARGRDLPTDANDALAYLLWDAATVIREQVWELRRLRRAVAVYDAATTQMSELIAGVAFRTRKRARIEARVDQVQAAYRDLLAAAGREEEA